MNAFTIRSFFSELEKIAALGDIGPVAGRAMTMQRSARQAKALLNPGQNTVQSAMNKMTRQGVLRSPQASAANLADSMARKGMLQRTARMTVR